MLEVTRVVVVFLASKVVFALKNDFNERIKKGNETQEKSNPIIMEASVENIFVGTKYSVTAPISRGIIKKKGGAANICALSSLLFILKKIINYHNLNNIFIYLSKIKKAATLTAFLLERN